MKSILVVLLMCFSGNCILGQSVSISSINYCVQNSCCINATRYLIRNDCLNNILLLLAEEEISKDNIGPQLKRKMLHPYGDFQLSMLEWEANLIMVDTCSFVPELFVKVLNPNDSFEIIAFSNSHPETHIVDLSKHILICKESDLASIGFPKFVYYLNQYNFSYQYSYIVIDESVLRSYFKDDIVRPNE